ncbi:MAG: FecR domain-containing protein [Asticcacaulis sp.]
MSHNQVQMERQAADWFLRLEEEPDNAHLREAFEAWLDGDDAHVQVWSRISGAGHELAAVPSDVWEQVAPQAPVQAVLSAPRRKRAGVSGGKMTGVRRMVSLVSALAACAAAVVIIPELSLNLQADHRTQAAQTQTVSLSDGSIVHMGPDSAVSMDVTDGHRQVRLLRGRAWFEVEPDASRPFEVRAGEVTTTVLGTAFEVYRQRNSVSVAVGHGRVKVEEGDVSYLLGAGQWVEAGNSAGIEGRKPTDQIGSWREGFLYIEDRPFSEVIEEIRPWYKGRIIVSGKGFEARRVTGFYDMRDPVAALQSLSQQGTGQMRQVTPWLIIISEK